MILTYVILCRSQTKLMTLFIRLYCWGPISIRFTISSIWASIVMVEKFLSCSIADCPILQLQPSVLQVAWINPTALLEYSCYNYWLYDYISQPWIEHKSFFTFYELIYSTECKRARVQKLVGHFVNTAVGSMAPMANYYFVLFSALPLASGRYPHMRYI